MTQDYKYDLFISYNRADEKWAEQLAARLEREDCRGRQLKVFFAPWDIRPGDSVDERLDRAFDESRYVGLVMSPESVGSQWVSEEWYATHHAGMKRRERRIIPLYRRTCDLPPFIAHLNRIDFRDDDKFEEGVRLLLAVLRDEPLPRGERGRSLMAMHRDYTKDSFKDISPKRDRASSEPSEQKHTDVFISYSHKDHRWLNRIQKMLKPFVRKMSVTVWDDTKIRVGTLWREEIKKAIESAKVAILLVSPDFIDSDFIAENELPPLLKAAKEKGLTIMWVAVSASWYEETDIANYQAVNDPSKPLDSLRNSQVNKELVSICKHIKQALNPAETSHSGHSNSPE